MSSQLKNNQSYLPVKHNVYSVNLFYIIYRLLHYNLAYKLHVVSNKTMNKRLVCFPHLINLSLICKGNSNFPALK